MDQATECVVSVAAAKASQKVCCGAECPSADGMLIQIPEATEAWSSLGD
jgi:hypothetical protein